jgi:hypothetical protein
VECSSSTLPKSWQLCRKCTDAPLGCAGQGVLCGLPCQHPCTQKPPEQVSDVPVCDPLLDRCAAPPGRPRLTVACAVACNDPWGLFPASRGESLAPSGHRVLGASIGPASRGVPAHVRFPYGFQDHAPGFLSNPVVKGREAQGPLGPLGCGDGHPSARQWGKRLGLECGAAAWQVSCTIPVEVAHRASVSPSRFSSLVGVDRGVRYAQPYGVTEQGRACPVWIARVLWGPLTQLLLPCAPIHR